MCFHWVEVGESGGCGLRQQHLAIAMALADTGVVLLRGGRGSLAELATNVETV